MDDDQFLRCHRSARRDRDGASRCGGSIDEPCRELAAWRVIRPGGNDSYRGYCGRHAVRLIRADQHAARFTKRKELTP